MLEMIELQNFKSFGESTQVPLEPITVLVGPNNSGKTCFLSLFRFINSCLTAGGDQGVKSEGGVEYLFHRPAVADGSMGIGWVSSEARYSTTIVSGQSGVVIKDELLGSENGRSFAIVAEEDGRTAIGSVKKHHPPFAGLGFLRSLPTLYDAEPVIAPIRGARLIRLNEKAIRSDSPVIPEPALTESGEGLAALLGLWSGADPERKRELDEFINSCLPEVKDVLVKPSPRPSYQRLWVRQADGQSFDADHVSDGVLFFIALATHVVSAERGTVLLIEEPENSIHPRRIHDVVELMRKVVYEKKCQIIVATHSRVLLDDFRDEPETIRLFGRSSTGTRVTRLIDRPDLCDKLHEVPPGDMIESGFFEELPLDRT